MPWSVTKKILIAVFVVFITLLYWEVGLRLIGKTAFPLLRTDREVGSIHVKNFEGRAWDVLSARKNYVHTNSIGYIGDDVRLTKATDTIRVALLGDSSLAGLQVDYYKSYPRLLEDALNTSGVCGKHFEVMNFGVGSAGTFSEYQTYKIKVAPFHPDYVVVMFADDYADNNALSQFDLEHYAEARKAVGLKSFLLNFELPKFLYRKLIGNATFMSMLRSAGILEGAAAPSIATESTGVATSTGESLSYYAFTLDIFPKFQKLVTKNGSAFNVVVVPNEQFDYMKKGAWKNDAHVTVLIDALKQQNIPVFNPSDLLAAEKEVTPGCITVDCANHFSEIGHRAMAKIMYSYVKNELLKNAPSCTKHSYAI